MTDTEERTSDIPEVERIVVRFAGDSGDGMQLTGDRFTAASALFGNDLATLPEYPAEIRAPAGTLAGVSAFQVHIADHDINTPGDSPGVLVAMNPAALKADLPKVVEHGTLIINSDAFDERNLKKAGYESNPLEDDSLAGYQVITAPMTALTKEACKDLGVKPRDAERSKNFFALGMVSWLYSRPTKSTYEWIDEKFKGKELVIAANAAAFKAGDVYAENADLWASRRVVRPAKMTAGTYTNINGNTALSWGLIAASMQAGIPLFLGSYPITPASDILHELAKHKNFGVRTFQAEDEIAAVGAALGAAYGGHIGITTTSGPGLALKAETIGLAVSLELPMVIIDVQRGGPSTGLPTKTEASDLMIALYGRHGEAPLPVVASSTPADCFFTAIEAVRIALEYHTPVILLSDGYLANGTEPWRLPSVDDLPDIKVEYLTKPNIVDDDGTEHFHPYLRDETLTRPWVLPGTPGLAHRIGGIEKDVTGNISYDPVNHEYMTKTRAAHVAKVADSIPAIVPVGDADADTVVLGWGSTRGAITAAVGRIRKKGRKLAQIHLRHVNPYPPNLGELLKKYDTVIIPEMNMGQLAHEIRAEFLVDAKSITKIMGQPFTPAELVTKIEEAIDA